MWVCRLPVHIGPAACTVFPKISGEFAAAQGADRVVGPYMTPANSCCPANFECKAEKIGPPEARRKRPRRNEPPRCARSLLSSAPVSSFPKRKRFAGLRFGARPRRNEPTFFVNLLFPVRFSGTSVSEFFSQDSAIPNQNPALALDRNMRGVIRYEKQRFCLEYADET